MRNKEGVIKLLIRFFIVPFKVTAILVLFPLLADAAVFHVSVNGTKTNGYSTPGSWTNSNCYRTIGSAINNMNGEDEVIVDDGVYVGTANSITNVPSGSSNNYTIIRARNPLEVIIDSGANTDPGWDYNARMIRVSGSYIEIDGFKGISRDRSNGEFITVSGSHVKLKRIFGRIQERMNGELYGVAISSGASYVLLEDCAFVGGYRYMVGVRGAGGTGAHHVIFRRVVIRCDWTTTGEPFSGFAVYGNNSSAASGPNNITFQNCIAIDGNDSSGAQNQYKHTPWYIFKGNHDIILDSCITINNAILYYMFIRNDYGGYNSTIKNSVFWENYRMGASSELVFRGGNSGSNIITGCTFGGQVGGVYANLGTSNGYLKNSLFVDLSSYSKSGDNFSSQTHNSFDSSSQNFGSNVIPYENDLMHIVRVEENSNRYQGGDGGAHVGAHIVKKVGVSGSLWGEIGWNAETDVDLWPWPNQDQIRDWFRATASPPSGASPSTNNTKRGFCADGQTLTKYIWEYLGNDIPPIEEPGQPAPPENLHIVY